MAHKVLEDGRVVVDWTTGDPEKDRITVLSAYRDFINEVIDHAQNGFNDEFYQERLQDIIEQWKVSTDNQIDEVPRIWIERPNP